MTSFDASLAARSRPRCACEKAAAAPRVPKMLSGEAAGASSLRLRAEVCVRVRAGHTSRGPGQNERSNPGGGAWHGTCGRTRGVPRDGRRHRTPSSTPRGAGRRASAPRPRRDILRELRRFRGLGVRDSTGRLASGSADSGLPRGRALSRTSVKSTRAMRCIRVLFSPMRGCHFEQIPSRYRLNKYIVTGCSARTSRRFSHAPFWFVAQQQNNTRHLYPGHARRRLRWPRYRHREWHRRYDMYLEASRL